MIQPANEPARIKTVEVRDKSFDTKRTVRAQVESDGSFRGRNLNGEQVRGFIRSTGDRTDVELRPGLGLDPTTAYRGSTYGASGSTTLRNIYNGASITGTFNTSSSGYRVR